MTTPRGARQPGALQGWSVAVLLLWLLVGPRIDLPPALHGMRVEDVVFVALAALCLLRLRRPVRPGATTLAVAAVGVTGLISAGVAAARGMVDPVTSVLYAVRPLEYWIAFPAALLLLRSANGAWTRRFDALLLVVTVLQTGFAVAQYYFGLPVGFSHAAYTRAAGLTVGPYELGAISAALLVYWVSRGRWTMASLASVALAASVSRVSILGGALGVAVLAAVWLVQLVRRVRSSGWRGTFRLHGRSRLLVAGHALSVVAAGLVLAFTVGLIHLPAIEPAGPTEAAAQPAAPDVPSGSPSAATQAPPADGGPAAPSEAISGRLASTSVLGSWEASDGLAAAVPHAKNAGEYQFAAYAGLNIYVNANTEADAGVVEASNLIRFFRWHLILDTFNDPADVIFGLGPSFVGPSVDGSYLRMFADGGLLGVLAWLALIVTWFRRSPLWMACVTITLLVGATFIDILYAERPMVLFWALLALAAVRGGAGRSTARRDASSDT